MGYINFFYFFDRQKPTTKTNVETGKGLTVKYPALSLVARKLIIFKQGLKFSIY